MPLASLEDGPRREEIRRRLAAFHPAVRRRWGTLSPGGAMCHLAICYEMVLGGAACSERTGPLERSLFRWAALYLPIRWARGYPTLPELVEGAPGVQPQGFADDRSRLLAAFTAFVAASAPGPGALAGRAHPIFGPLTHWEWMRWGYLHADHHLRQFGL